MILVIDVGTSGIRAAAVDGDGALVTLRHQQHLPSTPFPGLVEFDAAELSTAVLALANDVIGTVGSVDAVGITAQRASTVVWNHRTGLPIGPGLGWQDLRTVMECITARQQHGLTLAPNQSATKIAWLLANCASGHELADLRFGTVDTWLAYTLSRGQLHVTDHTNAAITGLWSVETQEWIPSAADALSIPMHVLPAISASSGVVGTADALTGAPVIAALAGDQQASLVGQACVRAGQAKITFGTGGMLDVCTGSIAPSSGRRSSNGTFPIVAFSDAAGLRWGVESIMLSAGTNVDWLRDDLGIIDSAAASHDIASTCDDAGGVVYVPAMLGLGTPQWDYGARSALHGITRGTTRAHVVRAVLEGVAHRGADLVESVIADTGLQIDRLRVDGGMSRNPTFVQALANSTQRPVEVSPHAEATTMGAAYLAGLAIGTWSSTSDLEAMWTPQHVVDPNGITDRGQWARAVERVGGWIPDLSALDF